MSGPDGHFDARVAASYDQDHGRSDAASVTPVVDCLERLADGGPVLEFAVGTGRIALPLAARGVPVHGIELSRAMVDVLRGKPGGDTLPVTIGDMANTRVEGQFAVVALVFNTIMNLCDQALQVQCFRNAAAHLAPGGCFVVEVMVPRLDRLPPGGRHVPFDVSPEHWGVDEYDTTTQRSVSHHLWFKDGKTERLSMPFRYVWPAELDLMAQLAGLELASRWGDWGGGAFTGNSAEHISVWRLPAP